MTRSCRVKLRTMTSRSRRASCSDPLGKGVPLNSQALEMLRRVREFYERERIFVQEHGHPSIPADKVIERTAATLGLSIRTVIRKGSELQALKDANSSSEAAIECETRLSTPGKKRKRAKTITLFDSFQEDAIRRHIYGYYSEKKYPTIPKLLFSLRESGLFSGSASSLKRVLNNLNFRFKPLNGRSLLLEKSHVVVKRTLFLQKILREDLNKVVWLDETWVNAGEAMSKGWTDDTTKSCIDKPSGKGGRLIIVHAGSASGFLPDSLMIFKSKKTGDYHEEMDSKRFLEWFEDVLNSLEEGTTIVMDNAPYHSEQINKAPNSNCKKEEMVLWLQNNGIEVDSSAITKVGLYSLIQENRPVLQQFVVDELANKKGHNVIRLPPYHCHFNPIELIWADIKGYVRKNNTKFTLTEVEKLVREAVINISPNAWNNKVQHVKKIIMEAIKVEGIIDGNDELMIALGEDSDNESCRDSDSDDELVGFQPLV